MGDITLALDKVNAPRSVSNFLRYSNSLAYNDTIFHRVIDGFMIQGGGFSTSFSSVPTEPSIPNEAHNGLLNARGTIAAARTSNPQSATSQFYINTVNNTFLDHVDDTNSGWGYAVFGQVTAGMDVVDQISKTETGSGGQFNSDVPLSPIIIQETRSITCDSE